MLITDQFKSKIPNDKSNWLSEEFQRDISSSFCRKLLVALSLKFSCFQNKQ